ncbi:hypothetical protein BB560_002753 [Smittium megazygosporum]|uniref:WD40 repeat-like protein n=1 Tax=Smittium megazygosporum TaxID=133381 RepID=A0A2T9ZDX9_9FUNG|nr:hypothetical protein BB560_002753 [Smittium megazygosporum]
MNCVSSFQFEPSSSQIIPYVQQIITSPNGIVASTSENKIHLFDYQNLNNNTLIGSHAVQLTNALVRDNLVLSSGLDKLVKVWDLRSRSGTPVQSLSAPFPLLSLDLNCTGQYVVGGSEQVDQKTAKAGVFCGKGFEADTEVGLFFWDLRMPPFELAAFIDSHSNDVTQINFHPVLPKQFLSSSTDGLVCMYDFEQTMDENDAMVYSFNIDISVQQAGYFGPNYEYVYCISDMNTLSFWTNESTKLSEFNDLCSEESNANQEMPVDYMISCTYDSSSNNMYLNSGDFSGNVHLFKANTDRLDKVLTLSGGHSDIVRSVQWDFQNYKAVSGGEDGKICLWSA